MKNTKENALYVNTTSDSISIKTYLNLFRA